MHKVLTLRTRRWVAGDTESKFQTYQRNMQGLANAERSNVFPSQSIIKSIFILRNKSGAFKQKKRQIASNLAKAGYYNSWCICSSPYYYSPGVLKRFLFFLISFLGRTSDAKKFGIRSLLIFDF